MTKRWNEEYLKGAHWETGKPSSHMRHFVKHLKPGCRILDAGCGSGNNSIFLSEAGHAVTGIDISSVAISKAREESKRRGLKIQFDVGDLNDLPYRNEEFDATYCGYVLHHTNLSASLAGLARVLASSGVLYVIMFQTIKYKDSSEYDVHFSSEEITSIMSRYFQLIKEPVYDEYNEVDEHGEHYHKRMVIILKKKG
jgi:ubiquinone/menaquinone biosynthesis C-methylase UbiE